MVNNNTRLYNNETKNCNYVALALASVHQGLKKGYLKWKRQSINGSLDAVNFSVDPNNFSAHKHLLWRAHIFDIFFNQEANSHL